MVALGAGLVTDQAVAQPAPYGLLSPATKVVRGDGPWINGFDYETLECGVESRLLSVCTGGAAVTAIENSGGVLYRHYFPFVVESGFTCSTFGNTPEMIQDRANLYAEAALQKSLEYEFWTGALSKAAADDDSWNEVTDGEYPNRYLASSGAVDVTPTPGTGVKTKHALALLEGALADAGFGGVGTIHVTREVGSVLGLKGKNGRIETNIGNIVVAGSGYNGAGPDGDVPDGPLVWVYATGPVTVRVGDVEVIPGTGNPSQAVDIGKNTIQYYTEQFAAVTWSNCAHFAVLVDLSLDYA